MNRQEIFDKAWKQALKMKAPAYSKETHTCAYRSPKGPCLIGALITNKVYKDLDGKFEGSTADETPVLQALRLSKTVDDELLDTKRGNDFLYQLQKCHDSAEAETLANFNSTMLKNLRKFARNRRLKIPKP